MHDPTCTWDRFPDAHRRVLAAWNVDVDSCHLEQPAEARGFSGADIVRVTDGDRVWCLRRWPGSDLSAARIMALHRFLNWLGQRGVDQVPVPAPTPTGNTLVTSLESWWQLEPWMPGVADFHQSGSDQRLRSLMQTLACVHRAADAYDCKHSDVTWFGRHPRSTAPAARERVQQTEFWDSQQTAAARSLLKKKPSPEFDRLADDILRMYELARGPVLAQLVEVAACDFRLHPCLRDLWHDHVLFTGEEVTGLIDPSATRMENVASDLSRLLGSLFEDDHERWETALEMYHTVRPLSNDERRLIGVLDRSSVLLSGLTWIKRRLAWIDRETYCQHLRDDEVPRVLPRLEAIARRLARLRP